MANTYYPQSDHHPSTMTVGQLMERLAPLDPGAPVIFRLPQYGVFGPGIEQSIDAVNAETMDLAEEHHEASSYEDEETGELIENEAYTQVFPAWSGVVIS